MITFQMYCSILHLGHFPMRHYYGIGNADADSAYPWVGIIKFSGDHILFLNLSTCISDDDVC